MFVSSDGFCLMCFSSCLNSEPEWQREAKSHLLGTRKLSMRKTIFWSFQQHYSNELNTSPTETAQKVTQDFSSADHLDCQSFTALDCQSISQLTFPPAHHSAQIYANSPSSLSFKWQSPPLSSLRIPTPFSSSLKKWNKVTNHPMYWQSPEEQILHHYKHLNQDLVVFRGTPLFSQEARGGQRRCRTALWGLHQPKKKPYREEP